MIASCPADLSKTKLTHAHSSGFRPAGLIAHSSKSSAELPSTLRSPVFRAISLHCLSAAPFLLLALFAISGCKKEGDAPQAAALSAKGRVSISTSKGLRDDPGLGAESEQKAASRVVTLAPSLSDVVIALGAADRLVGVTRFDDAPEIKDLPRVGGYTDPSVEAVIRLEPDLVLCQPSPGNRGAVEQMRKTGISVQVLDLKDLRDIESAYREVGSSLGQEERAQKLIDQLHADLLHAQSRAESRKGSPPKVVLLYGIDPLYAAGPGSFGDDLIRAAGGKNQVQPSAQAWPRLSVEWLAAQELDAVLLAGPGAGGSEAPKLPGGLNFTVHPLQSPGFLRPGPGVNEALEELGGIFDSLVGAP